MALLCILTTPTAYAKLQTEINTFYTAKENAENDVITFADAKVHFPYAQAIIREALRLWPPSAGLFTKEVPKNGDTMHGYYLPPGTEVGQCLCSIGRLPRIWGSDYDIFRPERWLEASPEKFDEMTAAVDLVFSSGKYVCLGRQIAWMELLKFLIEVCWPSSSMLAANTNREVRHLGPETFRHCHCKQRPAAQVEGPGYLFIDRLLDPVYAEGEEIRNRGVRGLIMRGVGECTN